MDAHLNTSEGRKVSRSILVVACDSVFSYPAPRPARIQPFSRRGPQEAPSGRESGMCENKINGFRGRSEIFSSLAFPQCLGSKKRNEPRKHRRTPARVQRVDELGFFEFLWQPLVALLTLLFTYPILLDQNRRVYEHEGMICQRDVLIQRPKIRHVP